MYKILTFTPVWKRPEVLEICLKGIKRLQKANPKKFKIQPFFVVSESRSAEILLKHKFPFVWHTNQPLGAKKNYGLNYALDNFDFDYIMEIGSDDLVTNSYLNFIEPHLLAEVPQFNLHDVYFIDSVTGATAYWETEIVLGAGRCISRKAIEAVKNRNIPFWKQDAVRGMDTYSYRNLATVGISNKIIKSDKIYSLDIKSAVNINTMEPFKTSPATQSEILAAFPEGPDILKLIRANSGK